MKCRCSPRSIGSCGILALLLATPLHITRAQTMDAQAASSQPQPPSGLASAITALLAQAHYWQTQNQPSQSLDALRRVLQLDPENTDALALRIQIELGDGDTVSAAQDIATLKQLHPADAKLPALMQMQTEAANPVDAQSLSAARAAGQAGNYPTALSLYQQSFHGAAPPAAYAIEYYQTMAGTPAGWAPALASLGNLVTANPDDLHAQLAYASVQTYQPSARDAGINRLETLTAFPAVAQNAAGAWKQALAFLPENTGSLFYYQAYLAKYPNDTGVKNLAAAASAAPAQSQPVTEDDDRARGFDALNANRLDQAATLFQSALAITPNDADALGGLGIVRLRQGQTAAAQQLLQRAIAANPTERAQWSQALNGAARAANYASASSLLNQGDLERASRQLRQIIDAGGDTSGAEAMLADVQTRQGDLEGAAGSWRAVLRHDPDNGPALVGLGTILARQGNLPQAQALFQQAEANGQGELVAGAQGQLLTDQAQQATSLTVALALYQAAVAAAPSDPWIRLNLARALRNAGQEAAARQQMETLIAVPNPSADSIKAAALFAAEDNRPADAEALVARLPPQDLTPDMQAIQARGALTQQIANAEAQAAGNPALTRQLLVTMAAAPDPDGSRGAAIATALVNFGDPQGAELAIQTAEAANPGASAAALIAYAGAMLSAGQDDTAGQIIQSLQARGGLTPDQQATVLPLRDGLAVRASDKFAAQGRLAEAYDQLSSGLTQSPQDPALNTALARLYQADHQPKQALAINLTLLRNDPNNLDARDGAVNAAIAAADWKTAAKLVQDGKTAQPSEPRVWMMAANLAGAQGDTGAALTDLQTAQNLRQQQLVAQSGGTVAVALAAAAPVAINPFGNGGIIGNNAAADAVPSILAAPRGPYSTTPVQADPLSQQIATQINTLQQTQASYLQGGISLEARSGSTGLDQLQTVGMPMIASFSPQGIGTIKLTVTPTFLSAGQVSSDQTAQAKFGSDALGIAGLPSNQSAAGIGVNAAYELPWVKANIGSTPFGFHAENLIGSLELDPQIASGLTLSLTAERQPVTDSLLSYAATTDPRSELLFGGVLRNRAYGQLTLQTGPGYAYVGGGADELTGQNVAKNSEIEFGGGGAYPIYQTAMAATTTGVNITYFAYNKNLSYFTLGQGGYFSPQSYFAATVPLDHKETDGSLTWDVGGNIGVQNYSENTSPYFPENPGLQSQLESAALTSSYLQAFYPAQSNAGIVGGAHGNFEYQLNKWFVVGGTLSYDRSGNWNDAQSLVYARYRLGDR